VSEGSIYQRKDGNWCGKWKDATGKWRYLYRKTKAEAKAALRAALQDRDDGIVPASKMTVDALLDEWLDELAGTVSYRTWLNRESLVRSHIKPTIGAKKLTKLNHKDLEGIYRAKIAEGLAPSTVKRIHILLNQVLKVAVRRKYISTNPVEEATPPRERRVERKIFSPEQVKRLLDAARGTRFECAYVLGAACGLRIGETLGLRFEDISFEEGKIKVSRTLWRGNTYPPKTHSSLRTLKLPNRALDALTRAKMDTEDHEWLFATRSGKPVCAVDFHHVWKKQLRLLKLPEHITYQQLRHGAASTLLNQGVPLPVVSRYIGHADPSITARVYSHIIYGMEDSAAEGINRALGQPVDTL
jgi:integrase